MRKVVFTVAVSLAFFFVITSCSKKQEAKSSEKQAVNQEDSKLKTQGDSLAVKSFPIRDKNNPYVTMVTDFGNMTLEMYRDVAPTHVDSFLARTKEGFYNGTIFHRVIDNFMIQGGDPKGNGTGNAGYFLPAEFSDLPHQEGTLSMARSRDPNSASCQFFICLARTAFLDKQYTVFGQLITGFDTLHKIGSVKTVAAPNNPNEVSKPAKDVYLRKVYISDAAGNER